MGAFFQASRSREGIRGNGFFFLPWAEPDAGRDSPPSSRLRPQLRLAKRQVNGGEKGKGVWEHGAGRQGLKVKPQTAGWRGAGRSVGQV
jgi:hypothetical protein